MDQHARKLYIVEQARLANQFGEAWILWDEVRLKLAPLSEDTLTGIFLFKVGEAIVRDYLHEGWSQVVSQRIAREQLLCSVAEIHTKGSGLI